MMNEFQIDSFISELKAEMDLIRVFQNEPVTLTMGQENILKKHKGSAREELRKKFLEEAKKHKDARVFLLICALEDKIKYSGLPAQTREELAEVIDKVKNNKLTLTPMTLKEIDTIQEKESENKSITVTGMDSDAIGSGVIGFTAGAVAAGVVLSEPINPPPAMPIESSLAEIIGKGAEHVISIASEMGKDTANLAIASNVDEKTAKSISVVPISMKKTAFKEASKQFDSKDSSIVSVSGTPAFSKKADAVFVEKVKNVAEKAVQKIAVKNEPITLDKIATTNKLSEAEKRYTKAAFVEEHKEVKEDLALADYLVKQQAIEKAKKRYQEKVQKEEKAKTAEPFDRSVARHDTLYNPQTKEAPKPEHKRPNYSPKEALVMKRVKKIKESAGVALTPQEVKERLNNPMLVRIYDEVVRREHPEFFVNQNQEAERKQKIAQIRAQRKLYQMQREAETEKENGKLTSKERKDIQKEVNEEFNGSLKKLIKSYEKTNPNLIASLQKMNVNAKS